MANSNFTSPFAIFLINGDSDIRPSWKEKLEQATTKARPLSRVKRVSDGGKTRVYEGWRASEIAETLDACCATDGPLWLHKVERLDTRGNLIVGYGVKNGHHLAWRQRNQEAAKANSRVQASKFRERARVEWAAYCKAYGDKFPGTSPVGFDRWCRVFRASWMAKGAEGIQLNLTRGMAWDVAADASESLSLKRSRQR